METACENLFYDAESTLTIEVENTMLHFHQNHDTNDKYCNRFLYLVLLPFKL